jgi:hypothetical protein
VLGRSWVKFSALVLALPKVIVWWFLFGRITVRMVGHGSEILTAGFLDFPQSLQATIHSVLIIILSFKIK